MVAAKIRAETHKEILRVERLAKRFVIHERERTIEAIRDLSFRAVTGELVGLVGASGSGKSSVLKCIYRTYLPTAGQILYQPRVGETVDLAQADDLTVLGLRRNEIRFVSQFLRVLPRRSTLQIVETTLRESGLEQGACQVAAKDSLQRVGLPETLWHLPPQNFSGGEKQLVNLAQALAIKPRLLLLDEPTASLDPRATEQVVEVIQTLKGEDMAMVAVFHDRRIIQRLAERTVELSGGLVCG